MKIKKQKLDHSDQKEEEVADADSSHTTPAKISYEDQLQFTTVIAKPMATKKLAKKLFKLVKKSSKVKKHLVIGVKMIQTQIRKGAKGIVILAGDVTPIDILCHIPGVCEELNLPYTYVPSRRDLGEAQGRTLGGGSMIVMIREHEGYKDLYDECKVEIGKLPSPLQ